MKELRLTENLDLEAVFGIHETPDSNYLICKLTGDIPYYLRIMKTDRQGNVLWVHVDTLGEVNPFQDYMVMDDKDSSYNVV